MKKSSNKRNSRRSLLLLLLLITGSMLGTSTYAWFTSNKTVSVSDITVNVAAKNGIQISVDGTNWKSIISTTDLVNAKTSYSGAVNQIPSDGNSIQPVSTIGTILDGGYMQMFSGDVPSNDNGDYILTATESTETNGTTGDFIAFDIFLKSDKAVDLDMTGSSGVSANGNDTGIKNASRIAFLIQGTAASDANVSTIQGLKLTQGSTEGIYFWEPNYNVHSGTGIANARDTYGLTITEDEETAVSYDGVKAEIAAEDNILLGDANKTKNADKFETVEITYLTEDSFGENDDDVIPVFSLNAGITKIRVYMWVEGQDVDCENNASGGNIDYSLQFTIHETEQTA